MFTRQPNRRRLRRERRKWARLGAEMEMAMRAFLKDPVQLEQSWRRIVDAQQRMITRRDSGAFDLLAIARESLSDE